MKLFISPVSSNLSKTHCLVIVTFQIFMSCFTSFIIVSVNKKTSLGDPSLTLPSAPDPESNQRTEAISSTIQESKHHYTFDNVAGLEHVKQTLRESLLLPAKFPALFQGCRLPWRSLLLYGPPGGFYTNTVSLRYIVDSRFNGLIFS